MLGLYQYLSCLNFVERFNLLLVVDTTVIQQSKAYEVAWAFGEVINILEVEN